MNKLFLLMLLGVFMWGCSVHKTKKSASGKPVRTKSIFTRIPQNSNQKTETLKATSQVKVTSEVINDYINKYKDIAVDQMQRYGVPASITLAQGILESGSGQGRLARTANNHFGIKCHKDWQGDSINHDDDAIGECFRKYSDPVQSFEDHSLFLKNRNRYAFLFSLPPSDYKGWAWGLKKAGYATDSKYPEKLISLIERYQLYNYDVYSPQKHQKTYVVQKGDTLYSVARRFQISIEELKNINHLRDNTIKIGQILQVK